MVGHFVALLIFGVLILCGCFFIDEIVPKHSSLIIGVLIVFVAAWILLCWYQHAKEELEKEDKDDGQ